MIPESELTEIEVRNRQSGYSTSESIPIIAMLIEEVRILQEKLRFEKQLNYVHMNGEWPK